LKTYASLCAFVLCIGPIVAHATETITYTYDARGRLVKVLHAGTVNNGVQAQYTHDKANNRKTIVVTGSPNPPPP
jgi:YD repeat-containing protein